MFEAELAKSKVKIDAIRSVLEFRDSFYDFLPKEKEWAGSKVLALMEKLPDSKSWRVYDHTACFSSLYTIYESYVHELITAVVKDFSDHLLNTEIPECLKRQYREGHSEILKKLDYSRYSRFSEADLALRYSEFIAGKDFVPIMPEAIYLHDRNLNMEWLNKLFCRVEFTNVSDWLHKDQSIQNVLELSDHARCDGLLKEFVDRRNECSHGEVDQVLSISGLIFFCDFIEALSTSLYNFCNFHRYSLFTQKDKLQPCGVVTEEFQKAGASVIDLDRPVTLCVGDQLALMSSDNYQSAVIQSIAIESEDCIGVSTLSSLEIGIKADIPLKKKWKVLVT